MTFEELHDAFAAALVRARMPRIPFDDVSLDLRSLDRSARFTLDPPQLSERPQLHVGAWLAFRWDALSTARARTCEEDVVGQLLGPDRRMRRTRTEPPWLRVDIRLWANTEWGKELPDPGRDRWRSWRAELDARLEGDARLVDDGDDDPDDDLPRIRGWQGEPEATIRCGTLGDLRLHAVRLEAWQALDLPRQWSDSRRRQDPLPDLDALLKRVAAGLAVWTRSLRHLLPSPDGR